MSGPVLELSHVDFAYRGHRVLEDVSLSVGENDFLAILGPNGGGKTTLLKLVLGLLEPDRGEIRVLGAPPTRAHGRCGYVPQHVAFDLDFPIRVLEVVLAGRQAARGLLRRFDAHDHEVAQAALVQVEMAEHAQRPIGALSGGQLQRVLIARALALEPALLLLDEPTASLDERVGRSMWELFEELSHEMTVVLVSHDVGAISRYVRGVACLNQRLHAHPSMKLTPEILEATYGTPVELLTHAHRVLPSHEEEA